MKHPTSEEWMSYLYGELTPAQQSTMRAHLEDCGECREQLAVWQSASQRMSEWTLPRRSRRASAIPLVRWAVAAAVVAFAIVGGVRLVALQQEVKELRAGMREQVQRELRTALAQAADEAVKSANAEAQALVAAVTQQLEEKRLADQQATIAALQKLNSQRITDYAKLRKELETVAVFSEAGLERAANQISSLGYTPASVSNDK